MKFNFFLVYSRMLDVYMHGFYGFHPLKDYVTAIDQQTKQYGAGLEVVEVTRDTYIAYVLHSREHEKGHVPNGLFEVEEVRPRLRLVQCRTT